MCKVMEFSELNKKEQIFFQLHVEGSGSNINKIKFINTTYNLLSKMPKGSICAEIGVNKGTTSKHILKTTNPKKLHLIDSWEIPNIGSYNEFISNIIKYQDVQKAYEQFPSIDYFKKISNFLNRKYNKKMIEKSFKQKIKNNQIEIHLGYSCDIGKTFPENYFDWVFIDAAHNYNAVKKDLEIYVTKMKKNGYILGHDYIISKFKGVVMAVNEFCKKYDWKIIFLSRDTFTKGENNPTSFLLSERNNNNLPFEIK